MTGSKFEIAGHTDDVGNDNNNKTLSQNRANSVLEYLVSKGISKANFTAVGYGETKPVAPNSTEEGRQSNRRVEIIFR
jgi:outer membrane protein OmpA-like peptidoglycan-associated protein